MPSIQIPYRLLLDDIDAAGVVFGPRLIAIAHRAVETALAGVGVDFAAILREGRFALPIVKIEADFSAALRHGDEVTLDISCARIGKGSFTIVSEIRTVKVVAAKIIQIHAVFDVVNQTGMALPESVRQGVARLHVDVSAAP